MTVEYMGPYGLRLLDDVLGLKYFYRVVSITLEGSTYTDEIVDDIAKLDTLQSLSLNGTRISSEGIARLKTALPKCEIETMAQTQRNGCSIVARIAP